MLMHSLIASRQRLTSYMLVTALLLLQVNLSLHQPLAHSLPGSSVATSGEPQQQGVYPEGAVQGQTALSHRHSSSNESPALQHIHDLKQVRDLSHSDLHEHITEQLAEHNSADHSHPTLFLSGTALGLTLGVAAAGYHYNRSHRSPAEDSWLRPPRFLPAA